MDAVHNQELTRMNRDIRRMREQIDTLKAALCDRVLDRTNLLMYNGSD